MALASVAAAWAHTPPSTMRYEIHAQSEFAVPTGWALLAAPTMRAVAYGGIVEISTLRDQLQAKLDWMRADLERPYGTCKGCSAPLLRATDGQRLCPFCTPKELLAMAMTATDLRPFQQRQGRPIHLINVVALPGGAALCGAKAGSSPRYVEEAADCSRCLEAAGKLEAAEHSAQAVMDEAQATGHEAGQPVKKNRKPTAAEKLEAERHGRVAAQRAKLAQEDTRKMTEATVTDKAKAEANGTELGQQMAAGQVAGSGAAAKAPRRSGPPEGMVKCAGSGKDATKATLAEGSLQLNVVGANGGAYDWRGKKVMCPDCGKRSGIYPVGRKKENPTPVGWKIDPHYRKA